MDDELQMLMNEFIKVQSSETNPLSERTVAEIMVKLHHDGFQFFTTTDNNEYITPKALDDEIAQLVIQRGKISKSVLPHLLNITSELIENRISSIVNKNNNIINHQNNLFSQKYLNSIVLAVGQQLKISGNIDLEQIAQKNQFNMIFTRKIILDNLLILQAELIGNELITQQYKKMNKVKIMGFCNAIMIPINLQQLLKLINVGSGNAQMLIQELIKERKIKGIIQNSYYIPEIFSRNQKQLINNFFLNNGYISIQILNNNFLVLKPQEWIQNNLKHKSINTGEVYLGQSTVNRISTQLNEMMQIQGFLEVSQVIEFEMDEKNLHKFIQEHCKISQYLFYEGYIFSEEWIDKCLSQFNQNVIRHIFQTESQTKTKNKKKQLIREQQLIQILYTAGLASYSISQNLAPILLPIILSKLEDTLKKFQKSIAQNKGFINNNMLKYKSCSTIVRSQEILEKMLNKAQKQVKNKGIWKDPDFGPTQTDKLGIYSLVYYDKALGKNWPSLDNLNWKKADLKIKNINLDAPYMKKSLLTSVMQIIDFHNKRNQNKIKTPYLTQITEESQAPFIFKFHISTKQVRFVLVDQLLPYVNEEIFGSDGIYGILQKAYAKLKYCYKAIVNLDIIKILYEVTGKKCQKLECNKNEGTIELIIKSIKKKHLLFVMNKNKNEKSMKYKEQETNLNYSQLYYIYDINQKDEVGIYPGQQPIKIEMLISIFDKIYLLSQNQFVQ